MHCIHILLSMMTLRLWDISKYPCLSASTMQLTVCRRAVLKWASILTFPCIFKDKYSFLYGSTINGYTVHTHADLTQVVILKIPRVLGETTTRCRFATHEIDDNSVGTGILKHLIPREVRHTFGQSLMRFPSSYKDISHCSNWAWRCEP